MIRLIVLFGYNLVVMLDGPKGRDVVYLCQVNVNIYKNGFL